MNQNEREEFSRLLETEMIDKADNYEKFVEEHAPQCPTRYDEERSCICKLVLPGGGIPMPPSVDETMADVKEKILREQSGTMIIPKDPQYEMLEVLKEIRDLLKPKFDNSINWEAGK